MQFFGKESDPRLSRASQSRDCGKRSLRMRGGPARDPPGIHPGSTRESTRESGQDRENGPAQVGPSPDRGIPTGTAPG